VADVKNHILLILTTLKLKHIGLINLKNFRDIFLLMEFGNTFFFYIYILKSCLRLDMNELSAFNENINLN